jgi:hypothetical protein
MPDILPNGVRRHLSSQPIWGDSLIKKLTRFTAVSVFVAVATLGGEALATTTISATVGPVVVPAVPVSVCVDQSDLAVSECVSTPPAQDVTLTVTVTVGDVTPVLVPPTVTPILCPAGTQGVALQVFSWTVTATIAGSVAVSVNGAPTTVPVGEVVTTPGQTVTIFACAGVSPDLI